MVPTIEIINQSVFKTNVERKKNVCFAQGYQSLKHKSVYFNIVNTSI